MLDFMMTGGPFMWLILIFAVINMVLIVKKAMDLYVHNDKLTAYQLKRGIHAIIFWAILSALVGYLGHYLGVYRAMIIISQAKEISPMVIAQGYAESLQTIKFGLTVLIVSAIGWGWLFSRYQKLQ
ncbi:MAG: MotA/TolQ/ExbB proton channel family protein [Candidatus Delongbacteria bacterium]|nr:MotA/TolQ/ExbB proton channel family protein [Candidatus Delongbacteria bacterium]